ncbi:MAG: 3'(2'),5'-bisphosphate nucleotidase CysQ, partial [Alphaproteobacteria bacterium]|nr:3'(2'),5'-bisphosphate nucleotidase CysQ [Alphaproteobacteria bacterium]
MTDQARLDAIIAIARQAGDVIMEYYEGKIEVDEKSDGSPVTAADRAADAVIVPALRELTPDIPVVS